MKRNNYIKPTIFFEEIEVEHLMTPSKELIETTPVAPDNKEEYGGGLGGGGSTGVPEEAKGGFWNDMFEEGE